MDRSLGTSSDLSEFAAACGQRAPLRFRIFDSRSGEVRDVQLPGPVVLVGSSKDCDLCLHDPEISRRHAYLQVIDGHLACLDLDSRTGIHLGKSSPPRCWLPTGETLHIGPYMLKLLEPVGDVLHPVALPAKFSSWDAPGESTAPFVLSFLNAHSRSGKKRVCRMVRRITLVGWSDVCNLRLQHNSVERVHCSFLALGGELWVVELKTDMGIEINDRRIDFQRLSVGDHMRLGEFQLAVVPLSEFGLADDDGSSAEMLATGGEPLRSHEESHDHDTRPASRGRRKGGGLVVPSGGLRPAASAQALTPVTQPAAPVPAAPMDPSTMAMLQHFQTMQQQYMDHTQQMLSMVVQAFSSAHNRQLDVIREELQRVYELNRELQELHARRAGSHDAETHAEGDEADEPQPAAAPTAAAPEPPTFPLGPPFAPGTFPAGQVPPGTFAPAPGSFPPGQFPAGQFPPGMFPPGMFPPGMPGAGAPPFPGAMPFPGALPPGPGSSPFPPRMPLPKAAKRPRDTAPVAGESAPAPAGEAPAAAGAKPENVDLHVMLSARINELERERSSRWSRIMQLFSSGGGS